MCRKSTPSLPQFSENLCLRQNRPISKGGRFGKWIGLTAWHHTKALNPVMDLPTISVFISLVPS
jgi:hypothetical protein